MKILRIKKKEFLFPDPLGAFEFNAICNALRKMQTAFMEQFTLNKMTFGFELEFYFTKEPSNNIINEIESISFVAEVKKETGNLQYEVTTFPHDSILEACDMLYIVRYHIMQIAQKHGIEVFFSAIMSEDEPPSAMQLSTSFHAAHTLAPLSHNSTVLVKIVQNVVSNVASLAYLCCPTEECYERIANYNFVKKFKNSPTHATWGTENRTVAIRVAPIPANLGNRVECRIASPMANPYYFALGLLASGMCVSNLYHPQTFVDSIHAQAKPLPRTGEEAYELLLTSSILKKIKDFCKKNAL